jgi:uncharacterized membrane protein YkvA (DUF1232 family)
MTAWQWGLGALAAVLLAYAGLVAWLVAAGRKAEARAFVRFVPDCVVLFRRLLSDSRLSRGPRLLVLVLLGYLATPFDLVPDFIPVAGQLDDAIIVGLVLRTVLRGAGPNLIREHWPGPDRSLDTILRLAALS